MDFNCLFGQYQSEIFKLGAVLMRKLRKRENLLEGVTWRWSGPHLWHRVLCIIELLIQICVFVFDLVRILYYYNTSLISFSMLPLLMKLYNLLTLEELTSSITSINLLFRLETFLWFKQKNIVLIRAPGKNKNIDI